MSRAFKLSLPPSPKRLPPAPITRRVRPRTYSVAVYIVGAIVVLQIAMLISVFWLRAMVVSVNVGVPQAKNLAGAPTVVPHPTGPAPPRTVEVPSLPSLATTVHKAPLLTVPGASDIIQQVSSLNEEAQILLHQNDLKHAAQALTEAEDLDPRNPTTLKNLAETYYLMNSSVRAKTYWQRLEDLGPGVGTMYQLAESHVTLLNSTADANTLTESSPYARDVYIDEVDKTPIETAGGAPRFYLQAVLMRKDATTAFEQKKLQVFVIFYRQMPDGRLLPDLTQRKGSFEDTFLFWNGKKHETFGLNYLLPAAAPGEAESEGEYYGFVIGVYYDKLVQDVRSEPADLGRRIPLPNAIE